MAPDFSHCLLAHRPSPSKALGWPGDAIVPLAAGTFGRHVFATPSWRGPRERYSFRTHSETSNPLSALVHSVHVEATHGSNSSESNLAGCVRSNPHTRTRTVQAHSTSRPSLGRALTYHASAALVAVPTAQKYTVDTIAQKRLKNRKALLWNF